MSFFCPALQLAHRPALQLAHRPALQLAHRPAQQPARHPALRLARRPALQLARHPALQPACCPALLSMCCPALQPVCALLPVCPAASPCPAAHATYWPPQPLQQSLLLVQPQRLPLRLQLRLLHMLLIASACHGHYHGCSSVWGRTAVAAEACGDLYVLPDWTSPCYIHPAARVQSVHPDHCDWTDSSLAPPTRSPLSAASLQHALPSPCLWPSQFLAPLPRSPAMPCLLCVKGRQHTTPHSSSFPPTTAPLQTLHMDMWGSAPVCGMDQEHYFLLVVDD
ncbi:unnamed protein product [Closterium sp. NIES-54]